LRRDGDEGQIIASLEQPEYGAARGWRLDRPCALLASLAERMQKAMRLICNPSGTQSETSHYV